MNPKKSYLITAEHRTTSPNYLSGYATYIRRIEARAKRRVIIKGLVKGAIALMITLAIAFILIKIFYLIPN